MTNNHVIVDAEQIWIMTNDGKEYAVEVVARDPAYDLALLKIKGYVSQKFPVLAMGDSDEVEAGDMVIALGRNNSRKPLCQ